MNRWIVFLLGYGAFLLGCFEHRLNIGGRVKKLITRLLFVFAAIVMAVPVAAQDFTPTVVQVKSELQAAGINLSGSCGAFAITNEVAKRVGLKLLHKGGGNRAVPLPDGSCLTGEQTSTEGFATDYLIMLPTGVGVDILGDGGGANIPQWSPEDAPDMVARNLQNWRNPVTTGVTPGPTPGPVPGPVQPPVVGNQTLSEILQHAITIEQVVADLQARNARIEGMVINHETQEAQERAKAEAFRQAVGHEYAKFFGFVAKYIMPAVGAGLFGWKVSQ